jgi:hypothetical protein
MRKLIHRLLDLASVAPGGPSSENSEKQSDHCSPPNLLGRSRPVQRSGHSKIEVRRLVGGALTATQTCLNKLRVQVVRTIAITVVTLPGLPGGLTWQVATVIDELPANRRTFESAFATPSSTAGCGRLASSWLFRHFRAPQQISFSKHSSPSAPRPNPRLASSRSHLDVALGPTGPRHGEAVGSLHGRPQASTSPPLALIARLTSDGPVLSRDHVDTSDRSPAAELFEE